MPRNCRAAVRTRSTAGKHAQDFVNRVAADPGLDSKPAAGDECAHQRGNICAARAERGAAKNREGDSVTRAGVRIQDHRNDDDQVAEKNRDDRLRPIHPAADERRGEHVSRNAGRHRNPKRGEAADAPFAAIARHRREIFVVKMIDARSRYRDLDIRRERDANVIRNASARASASGRGRFVPTNFPSRAATLPRTVTTCGRPSISNPSNEL